MKTGWVRRALKGGKGEAEADGAATWLVGLLTYWLINLRPAVKRRLKWVKWQWQWQGEGEGKGKSQLVWGRTARSQIGNGNDNRQARRRPRPYRANDRARLASTMSIETRAVQRRSEECRGGGVVAHWINGKWRKAKSAIFMLMNIIFLCLLSLALSVANKFIKVAFFNFNDESSPPSFYQLSLPLSLSPTVWQLPPLQPCHSLLNCPLLWDNEFYCYCHGKWMPIQAVDPTLATQPNPNPTQLNWTELNCTEFGANCARTTVNPPLKCRINNRITVYYLSLITCNDNYQCLPAWQQRERLRERQRGEERGKRSSRKDCGKVLRFCVIKRFNLFASIRQLPILCSVLCNAQSWDRIAAKIPCLMSPTHWILAIRLI